MRLMRATVSAAGSAILVLDPHKITYGANMMMYGNSTINATAQVDATISELTIKTPVTISRSSTTVTVTFPTTDPHTLGGTADYVIISGTGVSSIDGIYPLASVSSNTVLTYTSSVSGTLATVGYAVPVRLHQTAIASGVVSATTPAVPAANAAGSYIEGSTFSALILKCTSYTAGTVYLDVRQEGLK